MVGNRDREDDRSPELRFRRDDRGLPALFLASPMNTGKSAKRQGAEKNTNFSFEENQNFSAKNIFKVVLRKNAVFQETSKYQKHQLRSSSMKDFNFYLLNLCLFAQI